MQLTLEQLNKVIPGNQYVEQWHAALAQLLPDYGKYEKGNKISYE